MPWIILAWLLMLPLPFVAPPCLYIYIYISCVLLTGGENEAKGQAEGGGAVLRWLLGGSSRGSCVQREVQEK